MITLVLAVFLVAVAAVVITTTPRALPKPLNVLAGALLIGMALVVAFFSSAVYIESQQTGIVVRKFGPNLPSNRVVAVAGEKGPQAAVLGPGWHFGYWPWNYDIEHVRVMDIPAGELGVVTALDGRPLPPGAVFAPAWTSAEQMLDGSRFLAAEGGGFRGPQLTVLGPGAYRYNTRLFRIETKPRTVVAAGEVAVIKSNAGSDAPLAKSDAPVVVNGVALVGREERGIWREPLLPGAYLLHPDAYQVVKVKTTKRVYTYQDKKWAIKVRSKDGFTFPVDVRVGCAVDAHDAPYLVALLGDPDHEGKDSQEEEDLSVLEARVILPQIRTVFRNVAETMNALQFVNSRTEVERIASERMREELAKYRLHTDGVFIGQIDLDSTEPGRQLLATQTDREVATNQRQMYEEQKRAQETRATLVKAQEEAEQQKQLAAATYRVQIAQREAESRKVAAQGEADYITITAKARQQAYRDLAEAIGAQGVTTLELLRAVAEGKVQITPQVMVTGGGGTLDALSGTLLGRMLAQEPAPAPAAKPAPR